MLAKEVEPRADGRDGLWPTPAVYRKNTQKNLATSSFSQFLTYLSTTDTLMATAFPDDTEDCFSGQATRPTLHLKGLRYAQEVESQGILPD